MSLKAWFRKITPNSMLLWNRSRKKRKINKSLRIQAVEGNSYSKQFIKEELKRIGIERGDTVLVHSALSKIGHLEEGPKTFVDAIIESVDINGHVLMPTSPNNIYQLDYINSNPVFDVNNTPSKTGAITEYFRKLPGVVRSIHPTEPVSVCGPKSQEFIKGHFKAITPYKSDSPFAKLAECSGKILYIGVTLDNAGTSLHTLEDAIIDFKYPVYYPKLFETKVIDNNGRTHQVKTKVHDPYYSKLRKCDALIPYFESSGVLKKAKIGKATTLIVDAKGFFDTMVKLYHEKGITMYTPKGENL